MIGKIKRILTMLKDAEGLSTRVDAMQQSLGRIEHRLRSLQPTLPATLADVEFKVYSQWGEDGIIQFLVDSVQVPSKRFVEFGVQDYKESNTRFLLQHNNWSGLVLDASPQHIRTIRADHISYLHHLKSDCAFITRDNINELLSRNGMTGDLGLLSIDIDGNDYWIWEAVSVVTPAIVVVEYNHRFGPDRSVTIPYDERFVRSQSDTTMFCYGASLKALWKLGKRKGYALVGCTSSGVNAFFVRTDLMPGVLRGLSAEDAFVRGGFHEPKDSSGRAVQRTPEEEIEIVAQMPVVEV